MNPYDQFDTQSQNPYDQFDTGNSSAPDINITASPSLLTKAVAAASDVGAFVSHPSEVPKAFMHGTTEFLKGTEKFGEGIGNAISNTEPVQKAMDWLVQNHPDATHAILTPVTSATEAFNASIDGASKALEPTTGTGKFLSNAVQFAEGFAGVSKFAKAAGVAEAAGGALRVAGDAVKSGVTMATFFDPYQERLSNLIQSSPSLANPVASFLAASPDDGEAVARLKNGLEGVGVGVALDGLVHGISAIKSWRSGDTANALGSAQAATDTARVVKASEAPLSTSEAVPAAAVKPGDEQATGQGATPFVPRSDTLPVPKRMFTDEQAGQIADGIVGNKRANLSDPYSVVPTEAPNMAMHNLKYILGTDAEKQLATTIGQKIREQMEMTANPEENTFGAVRVESDKMAEVFGADPAHAFQTIANTGGCPGRC